MKKTSGASIVWILVAIIIIWVIANPGSVAHILNNLSQIHP
jgi:hypothetical protein